MAASAQFCGACGGRQEPSVLSPSAPVARQRGNGMRPTPVRAPPPSGRPVLDSPPQGRARPPVHSPIAAAPRALPSGGDVPASLGKRVGAALLDSVFNLVVIAVAFGLVYLLWMVFVTVIVAPFALAALFSPAGVAIYLMARDGPHNGQTFGKQIADIRVISLDGGPMTVGRAASRELLWRFLILGMIGGILVIPALLNLFWPLFDARYQALHDKGARTLVIEA